MNEQLVPALLAGVVQEKSQSFQPCPNLLNISSPSSLPVSDPSRSLLQHGNRTIQIPLYPSIPPDVLTLIKSISKNMNCQDLAWGWGRVGQHSL